MHHAVVGFSERAKCASLTEYGRKRSEGRARIYDRYVRDTNDAENQGHSMSLMERVDRGAARISARRNAWDAERKGLGNLKRLIPFAGTGRSGEEALQRLRSKKAMSPEKARKSELLRDRNVRFLEGQRALHQRLNKEHPVQGPLRDLGMESASKSGRNSQALIANRRAKGQGGGRFRAMFASQADYAAWRRSGKTASEGAELASTKQQIHGEGAGVSDAFQSLVSPETAAESEHVARDRDRFRRFHGHDGDGELGRP